MLLLIVGQGLSLPPHRRRGEAAKAVAELEECIAGRTKLFGAFLLP